MKTFISIILFVFFAGLNANAQYSAVPAKSKKMIKFLASRTQVVLTGDSLYDTPLKEAIKNWTITPIDFIKSEDVEKNIKDETKSFMLLFGLYADNIYVVR